MPTQPATRGRQHSQSTQFSFQKQVKRRGRNPVPLDCPGNQPPVTRSKVARRKKQEPHQHDSKYPDNTSDFIFREEVEAFMKELSQSISQLVKQQHWKYEIPTIAFEDYFRYLNAKRRDKLPGQQKEIDSILNVYLGEAQKLIDSMDVLVMSTGVVVKGILLRLQEQWQGQLMLHITYDRVLISIIQHSGSRTYLQSNLPF
jgi:hypothetical protein